LCYVQGLQCGGVRVCVLVEPKPYRRISIHWADGATNKQSNKPTNKQSNKATNNERKPNSNSINQRTGAGRIESKNIDTNELQNTEKVQLNENIYGVYTDRGMFVHMRLNALRVFMHIYSKSNLASQTWKAGGFWAWGWGKWNQITLT